MFYICQTENGIKQYDSLLDGDVSVTHDVPSWLHLQGDLSQAGKILKSLVALPLDTETALFDEYTRPRSFTNISGDIVGMLRAVEMTEEDRLGLVSLRFWLCGKLLVTVSKFDALSVIAVRELLMSGKSFNHTDQLLFDICYSNTEHLLSYSLDLDESIAELEEQWEDVLQLDSEALHSIRQRNAKLQRYLQPQHDALQRLLELLSEKTNNVKQSNHIRHQWRIVLNNVKREIEASNELRDRVSILRDAVQQKTMERTNRIMLLLSMLSACFLPLTLIASLLGMNVSGIPGNDHPLAFLIVCLAITVMGLCQWALFRHWRWLK